MNAEPEQQHAFTVRRPLVMMLEFVERKKSSLSEKDKNNTKYKKLGHTKTEKHRIVEERASDNSDEFVCSVDPEGKETKEINDQK